MSGTVHEFRASAQSQAEELVAAIEAAEAVIISTIERECEALRSGRMLAARALHTRLCDAATIYINAARAARASIWTIEQMLPGSRDFLEERRSEFGSVLKVELAVLQAEREAVGEEAIHLDFDRVLPASPRPDLASARVADQGTAAVRRDPPHLRVTPAPPPPPRPRSGVR